MGLGSYNWEVIFANDISDKKFQMYKPFFPDIDEHCSVADNFDINPSSVPSTTFATCSFPRIHLSLAVLALVMGSLRSISP
jgi:hypothetical protein